MAEETDIYSSGLFINFPAHNMRALAGNCRELCNYLPGFGAYRSKNRPGAFNSKHDWVMIYCGHHIFIRREDVVAVSTALFNILRTRGASRIANKFYTIIYFIIVRLLITFIPYVMKWI